MASMVSPNLMVADIVYPDSDGAPMADNTIQYQYMITIQVGLDAMFESDPQVFVAANLFWYPVQFRPDIHQAPDVMVAFGRPKGDRRSYRQWDEGGIAPQVVFEIISESNTVAEMKEKRKFYERHRVEEYYEYDPASGTLDIWKREGDFFRSIGFEDEWRSPRLGVTLKLEETGALSVYGPDGRKFQRPVETLARAEQAETRAEQAETRAEQAETRAEQAETRAEQAETRAEQAEAQAARLAARLRELGINPETVGNA
jgi:Uma2 family endonuclease